jgi:hypothetical protein
MASVKANPTSPSAENTFCAPAALRDVAEYESGRETSNERQDQIEAVHRSIMHGLHRKVLGFSPSRRPAMPKYVIERDLPGAGKLSAEQLQGISAKSCSVLNALGPQIQWVQSYVTDDKIYCVYVAPNPEIIREHAARGGFPANRISEVKNVIDPTTADAKVRS